MSFLGNPSHILPVMKSHPGAFLALRFASIIIRISLGVKNLIGFVIGSGSYSVLSISF
jgi:hypothetical protein